MKKIKLIIILSIFTAFYSCVLKNKFANELTKFRFELNDELEKYNDEKIYKWNFSKNDRIIILIDNFVSENKSNIKKYRENILEQYVNNSNFKLDTTKYKKVDFSEINNLADLNISAKLPISKLLWINPFEEISTLKSSYISRKGVYKLSLLTIKKNITSSLIKTKQISDNQWEIIDNSYDIVYKSIYDLEKGKVIKIEIFEKK